MRPLWIPALLAAACFTSASEGHGQENDAFPGGEQPNSADPASRPAFSSPAFQRQPLGAFQPTDIGLGGGQSLDPNQPPAEGRQSEQGQSPQPEPPQILTPAPGAAPIGSEGERAKDEGQSINDEGVMPGEGGSQSVLRDNGAQEVAPAQFQSPSQFQPSNQFRSPGQFQSPGQSQPSNRSQSPAQANSPAQGQSSAEPKTTLVPPSAAPAFQPADAGSGETDEAAPPQPEPQSLAQSLYQQALAAPAGGAIEGTPLTLHEALVRRSDPSRYAEFVKGYWRLSRSMAAYHESLQGATELTRLPQSRFPHEQALLQAAVAQAEAEVRQARLQATTAQWTMAEQFGANDDSPPSAADLPLIGAYKSKFEAVFAGRTPPAGARRLHESFEPRRELIDARAGAIVASENAFGALADAYANGQVDLGAVLREHARLHAARMAFLEAVYDYNAAIADYAYLAAGPNRSPEIIISMLVERKKANGPQNVSAAQFNTQ